MKNFRNIKHIFFIIAISLTILFGSYHLLLTSFMSPINHFFIYRTGSDSHFQDFIYTPNLEPSENIVIIEIDDESINSLGGQSEYAMLNIEKNIYTKVLEILQNAGAKAVGFDIVFQNPDKNENIFAQKLQDFKNAVIAVVEPNNNHKTLGNFSLENCTDTLGKGNLSDYICPFTPRSVYGGVNWGIISSGENTRSQVIEEKTAVYNLKDHSMQYTIKTGSKEIENDDFVYTMGLAMALGAENENAKKISEKILNEIKNNKKNGIKKSVKIPQPFFAKKNISGQGQPKPYTHISLAKLVDPKYHIYNEETKKYETAFDDILKDAYVLIGESGELLHDTAISPVTGQSLPGVYFHAFLLDGILQDKIPSKVSLEWMYIGGILVTIFAVFMYFFLPKFLSPIIAGAAIIFTIFIARYLYANHQIIFDILPFLLGAGLITYPATYIYKFFIIDRDKRMIMNAFSRYLSPNVVELIDANKIEASLGGEKKELSILFSDIAGFTTISEKIDTKDLFIIMTKYLSEMTEILIAHKGTLDKYIGDAVMGFFGAPVDDPLHAVNACNTALAMREKLGNFNAWLKEKGYDTIDFRIGIATGEVMVGNIGSERQFNYTVLGDTVNLASRLEGIGKEYGVNIIIASSTKLVTGDMFLLRELDYIAVKGKNSGVRIYELLGKQGENPDSTKYTTYETALRLYREGKYIDAGRIWEKIAPIDPPSEIMMHRCVALIKGEMQLENGIYKMTHK